MKSTFWRTVFGVALLGAVLLELPAKPAPLHAWDYPLFYAMAGLLGCLALSFFAKGVMSPYLDRPEDHYGEAEAEYDWSTESPAAAQRGREGRDGTGRGGWDGTDPDRQTDVAPPAEEER